MGTAEFAVPTLRTLITAGYDVDTVVTGPDKPRGRGQRLLPTPVKSFASEHHLTILQPEVLSDPAFKRTLTEVAPDLIIVVAFRILPREIFTLPRKGSINLHASLLPRYRGAAPIQRALMAGERETGVTTFFLKETVDTGNILVQEHLAIREDDDAGSLHDSLAGLGAGAVLKTVKLIEEGKAVATPQDPSFASLAPKIFRDDCLIRWDRSGVDIRNQIRALSPEPGAFTTHQGKILKIYRAAVVAGYGSPGLVEAGKDYLRVGTADGILSITELAREGGRRMRVAEFLRGYVIANGERFG
jgi:methionyl-tRNA formyltransferase